ncbi:MAG: hypothetical protein LW875_03915 [Proteobacteria bacterium]|nr:hypothetical protein [Pseudomonadota bacterium]
MMMTLLLYSTLLNASELPGEPLWEAPTRVTPTVETPKPLKPRKPSQSIIESSNLPTAYSKTTGRQSTQSELILPRNGITETLSAIRVGDVLELTVNHSVIGFPDEKAPVLGIVESGSFRGARFLGDSYLEQNSRRIFINFHRLVLGPAIYRLSGVAVSEVGQPGLTGVYHSREAEYFTGDFIASFAAGYFDGLVPRRTNVFGQVEADTSVDAAVKKGLSSGALSTAERFKEKLKKVPEFSEIQGPFKIKILILEPAIGGLK